MTRAPPAGESRYHPRNMGRVPGEAATLMTIDQSPPTWRAWAVWIAGSLAFVAAMFSRTSFGVAGMVAAEQFGSPVTVLGTFVMVQLVVYAALEFSNGHLGFDPPAQRLA